MVPVTPGYAWSNNTAVAGGFGLLILAAAAGFRDGDVVLAAGALTWMGALALLAPVVRSPSANKRQQQRSHRWAYTAVKVALAIVVVVAVAAGLGAVMYWRATGRQASSTAAVATAAAASFAAVTVLVRAASLLRDGIPTQRSAPKQRQ